MNSELAQQVAAGDPDRFRATLGAPPEVRPRLWLLYALNLQVAQAPWASGEPLVAEMRLQWWIDALQDPTLPGAAGHPLLGDLMPLLQQTPALRPVLVALAEARRRDCWREGFASQGDLGAYLDATSGNLMWAAALVLGAPAGTEPVVRDFAWAAGLANWLRAVPALTARGLHPLPDTSGAAVAALARQGLARLAAARARRAELPRQAAPALFSGWLAPWVLARAAAAPGRVAGGGLEPSEFRRRASLLRPVFTGRW